MKRIVILGASGFGKEIAWVIDRINTVTPEIEVLGFCDDAPDKQAGVFAGFPLLGSVERFAASHPGCGFSCAIGSNRARQQVAARALAANMFAVSVIDPSAIIAPDAVIADGAYVGISCIVSVGASLGSGVIVNHQACVGHDVQLGHFSQVCPGARISGGCEIGEGALLGTNAAMIPLKKMGAWSVLGAGTTALSDIPCGSTLVRLR
jgi:sugar O-acyltransferase (sialic acid O-acetyltransferase NeuD family)